MRGNWSAKLIKQFAYITDWEGFWPGTSAALCAVRIWLFFHWSGTSDEDRKHGKDGAVVERRPRPPCRMGKDACNQHSFPKTMLQIFQCWFLQFYQIPAFGQWPWNKRYFPENVSVGINKRFSGWKTLDVARLAQGFRWCCQGFWFWLPVARRQPFHALGIPLIANVWVLRLGLRERIAGRTHLCGASCSFGG